MDQQLLHRLELALERKIYKESFYEFYKVAFCQLHPGTDYDENWHAEYLCDILQKEAERIARGEPRVKDIIINVPFRSSKSILSTVVFPVWCWCCVDASMKFITTAYSGDLALEHARRSMDLLETVWIQRLYKNVARLKVAAISHYENYYTGMRKAVGVGGQITGSGSDIIICLKGDQKILTDRGEIEISKIVNEKLDVNVFSFNHKKGRVERKKIIRYDKNIGRKLIKIKTKRGRELLCTLDHEVWTENRGYVKAGELTRGDIIKIL